ncbi:MAG TPA: hypothetical protein VFS20_15975 [Longimicrobium sp.]|nr:hypothetical protein [Longimicrobium sp.]
MQKLRLDLDRLSVESFPTSIEESNGLGTVHARGVPETIKLTCPIGPISTIATNPTCCPCTP